MRPLKINNSKSSVKDYMRLSGEIDSKYNKRIRELYNEYYALIDKVNKLHDKVLKYDRDKNYQKRDETERKKDELQARIDGIDRQIESLKNEHKEEIARLYK